MRAKQNKPCKRRKCPYFNLQAVRHCEYCEWNKSATWSTTKYKPKEIQK